MVSKKAQLCFFYCMYLIIENMLSTTNKIINAYENHLGNILTSLSLVFFNKYKNTKARQPQINDISIATYFPVERGKLL